MFNNRLLAHMKSVDSKNRLNTHGPNQAPASLISSIYVSQRHIYQVAHENAKRDVELDRLFNPDFYEHGGGI